MRREGRVRGKPSSKSRHRKARKSVLKHKRITADDPPLTEFVNDRELVESANVIIHTVESFEKACTSIDAAKLMPADEEAFHAMASNGANRDIPAIEEAFHKQLGIFENAVEGDKFAETQFTRKWGAVLSEESDVEFVEVQKEEDDDDWIVVLDGPDHE